MNQFIIDSEEKAFEFLKQTTSGQLDLKKTAIKFENWPKLHIHVKGDQFDSSLSTDVMQGMIDLQYHIRQSYAMIVYEGNMHRLTPTDKERLTIIVKVSGGSSNMDINLQELAEQFVNGAMAQMTSEQLMIIAVTGIITIGGTVMFKSWVAKNTANKELETRVELSKEETARIKIIQDIASQNSLAQQVLEDASDARRNMVKKFQKADSVEIEGVTLQSDDIKQLTMTGRTKSDDMEMNDTFRITVFDAKNIDYFKVYLVNDAKELEFSAKMSKKMSPEDINLLFQYFKERKPLTLHIKGKKLHNEIKYAEIVSVKIPSEIE